jgi:hypothetical protein
MKEFIRLIILGVIASFVYFWMFDGFIYYSITAFVSSLFLGAVTGLGLEVLIEEIIEDIKRIIKDFR